MGTTLGTLTKNSDFSNINEISQLQLSADTFLISCDVFLDWLNNIDSTIGNLPALIDAV